MQVEDLHNGGNDLMQTDDDDSEDETSHVAPGNAEQVISRDRLDIINPLSRIIIT